MEDEDGRRRKGDAAEEGDREKAVAVEWTADARHTPAQPSGTRLRRRMSVGEHGAEAKNKCQAVRSTDATERRQYSRLPIARAQVEAIDNAG